MQPREAIVSSFIRLMTHDLIPSRFATRYEYGDIEIKRDMVSFAEDKLFGRSLLAGENPGLYGMLAIIGTRVPLEFNASNFVGRKSERILVEKHMRVCLGIKPGFESAVTVAASEPLLAEAARLAMNRFLVPQALVEALSTSGLDKGDRGELIAMLILLRAQDNARVALRAERREPVRAVPVEHFLRALIPKDKVADVLSHKRN